TLRRAGRPGADPALARRPTSWRERLAAGEPAWGRARRGPLAAARTALPARAFARQRYSTAGRWPAAARPRPRRLRPWPGRSSPCPGLLRQRRRAARRRDG